MLALRRKCPMADKLIEMSYATQKVKNLYDKYAREFRYMRKHSGYAFTRANMLNTNQKVVTLYDTLSIEVSMSRNGLEGGLIYALSNANCGKNLVGRKKKPFRGKIQRNFYF